MRKERSRTGSKRAAIAKLETPNGRLLSAMLNGKPNRARIPVSECLTELDTELCTAGVGCRNIVVHLAIVVPIPL